MYELYQKRKDVGSHYPRTRSLSLVRQHFSIFLAKLIEASLNSIAALHSRSAQSAKPFSQRVDTVHALNLSALPSVDRVHAPSCLLPQPSALARSFHGRAGTRRRSERLVSFGLGRRRALLELLRTSSGAHGAQSFLQELLRRVGRLAQRFSARL